MSSLIKSLYQTFKDKRVWKWEVFGLGIYATPAAIRFLTKNPVIPILNAPYTSPYPFIPPNLVEKLTINMLFPGGAGAVAGETFFKNYYGKLNSKLKYMGRIVGALSQYMVWSTIQYFGYHANIIGPHGENIFEGPNILPFNLLIALLSVFILDLISYTTLALKKVKRKLDYCFKQSLF